MFQKLPSNLRMVQVGVGMQNLTVSSDSQSRLNVAISGWPSLITLCDAVLAEWPEHAEYLARSFEPRSARMLATSDYVAAIILVLVGDRKGQVADDYRWLCERIRDEEIEFSRTGKYRYKSFAETNAHVYSDDIFMARYMHGLLLSHVLWFMHASSLQFFRERLEARVARGGKVLEVGSGHGLLLHLALTDCGLSEAHGWDLSAVSLAQTRHAMARMGVEDAKLHFRIQDMHRIEPNGDQFDLVILSHILEHLDEPIVALQKIRSSISKRGILFVNVPLNAPMPDHIVLLETPGQASALLVEGGFRIVEIATHTTQAKRLSLSLRQKLAVTCSIIAEVA